MTLVFRGNASSPTMTNGRGSLLPDGHAGGGRFRSPVSKACESVEAEKTPPSEARPWAPTSTYVKLK